MGLASPLREGGSMAEGTFQREYDDLAFKIAEAQAAKWNPQDDAVKAFRRTINGLSKAGMSDEQRKKIQKLLRSAQ